LEGSEIFGFAPRGLVFVGIRLAEIPVSDVNGYVEFGHTVGNEKMDNDTNPSITELRKRKFANQIGVDVSTDGSGAVADSYFEEYSNSKDYEDNFEGAFDAKYLVDLIKAAWNVEPPYKLLDCGSANGLTLTQFDKLAVEAWGIENNAFIHSKTPQEWRERNRFADVLDIPFEDKSFDYLYVTCLPYLPEEKIDQAVKELFRVCRLGVVYHGTTTDMTEEVIENYQLFAGLRTFWTFSEWSTAFVRNGFRLAISNSASLDEVWRVEQDTDGDFEWYPNKESMRYSFFSTP
jgi:ubiquinone/menaquinone biosynthesis C-methylase UbiE